MTEMTDKQLLRWLRDNLEWDGHGYWLPEICVKESYYKDEFCAEPTMKEFRASLIEKINEKT